LAAATLAIWQIKCSYLCTSTRNEVFAETFSAEKLALLKQGRTSGAISTGMLRLRVLRTGSMKPASESHFGGSTGGSRIDRFSGESHK
jgi:hypothetical protein